ncbi:MAG TPA: hypothetical protein VGM90_40895 [Kofleriaceae bacterium]
MSSICSVGIIACVLAVSAGYALAAPVKEVELEAPWNTLDLSSGDAETIYKSVGAKYEKQKACDRDASALTAGVCWTTWESVARWTVGLEFDNVEATKKFTAAWGPADELNGHDGHKLLVWYLRAGKKHLIASWEQNGDPGIEIEEMTPVKDAIVASLALLGKKAEDIHADGAQGRCRAGAERCQLDFGKNEMAQTAMLVTFAMDKKKSTSVAIEMLCGGACAQVQPRLEDAFGKPTSRTCDGVGDFKGGKYVVQKFASLPGATAFFDQKSVVGVRICAGRCTLPCK